MSQPYIHINCTVAQKGRLVQASRAKGMKLGDWALEMIERAQAMQAYPITDQIAPQYKGAGYALAAIIGGQVVALRYVLDVATGEVADQIAEGGTHAAFFVRQWLQTDEAAPVVRELQALGQVSVGMASCWEFCEL